MKSILVEMYAKCGSIDNVCRVLKKIPFQDVVIWKVMISRHAKCNHKHKALELFQQMKYEGVQ
jgi:pentatricopeptide repeat protein